MKFWLYICVAKETGYAWGGAVILIVDGALEILAFSIISDFYSSSIVSVKQTLFE
jgi:hypothetical protein